MLTIHKQKIEKQDLSIFLRDLASTLNINLKHMVEDNIQKNENETKYKCYIANDNSNGQIVVSGKNKDIDLLIEDLKKNKIKNIKLPVSAPFHCKLMSSATEIMKNEITNAKIEIPKNSIISNVTAIEERNPNNIKDLLIKQIESPVRWRESVIYMIDKGVRKFIEIGPGKVLSGLIKRIDKTVEIVTYNSLEDIKNIK